MILQENDDEFGRVKVWSTDSEDDEVRRPTHGGCFVEKDQVPVYQGRCLTVNNNVSEQKGCASNNFFAAKPVTEQISVCEDMISKVHSILESLNIHVSRCESELEDLKYTVTSLSDS